MISVVIPSHNHARFIGEAVDSVRDQTLPVSELLVIDDGSGDGSLDVLADHAFPGMRVVAQDNRGAHATINRAVSESRGDFVAILNSDDVFEPERIEHAWAVARAERAALVFGSVSLIDAEGRPLSADHETARWYSRVLASSPPTVPLAKLVRRENVAVTTSNFFLHRGLWRALGGFSAYRYVHDYDFLLRALQLCPERVVHASELRDVRYRVHGGNTITEDVDRALAERARMLRALRRPGRRLRSTVSGWRRAPAVRRAIDATPLPRPVEPGAPPADSGLTVGLVARSLGRGGLEEVVGLLARALPAVGVRAHVLCTDGGGSVADRLRRAGVPVTVGRGEEAAWRAWRSRVSPDVLSTHFVDARAVAVLGETGIPVVETVHNTYAWLSDDEWAGEAEKRTALAATIAVSELVSRYHDARCPGGGPTHVVPNSVHPHRAARVPRAWARRRLGIPGGSPLFVHLGRVTPQKNLPMLLDALEDVSGTVPEARLLLVGSSERALETVLGRRHRALSRQRAVRHVPDTAAVGAVLSAADAYVSSSFYEGWSVAASEALWVGRPVLLTECGGAAELVGPGGARGRLVPNPLGDPLTASPATVEDPPSPAREASRAALAEAMREVVALRGEWAERADEIRAFARTALAPRRMAAEYAKILGDVSVRS